MSQSFLLRCLFYERAKASNWSTLLAVTADQLRRSPDHAAEQAAWFEVAFNEHWTRVYSVLFQLVGERAEAEDLALEVFWRLYSRPPRSTDNLGGWLYRVAANLGLNALRARKRRLGYEQQAGQDALVLGHSSDPVEEIERAEKRRLVQATLAHLKAARRAGADPAPLRVKLC